jgi:hypothetical protein
LSGLSTRRKEGLGHKLDHGYWQGQTQIP